MAPNCVIILVRGISAVGSAPHWQCGGHGFKSRILHFRTLGFIGFAAHGESKGNQKGNQTHVRLFCILI